MNLSVYLFGELGNGYTQYPSDYTSTIFDNFYQNAKSNTQIAIHREGNLMYYGYVRKLEKGYYIGLCVVLNDLCIPVIDKLFPLYETIISDLVTNGLLIHFNENGDIVSNVSKLHLDMDKVNSVSENLRMRFNSLESYARPLPALKYGISKDSIKDFTLENNLSDIVDSSFTNGYTFIYKNKNFNTVQINSYKSILNRLNEDNYKLRKKNEELLDKNRQVLRQKEKVVLRSTLGVITAISIVVSCAIFYVKVINPSEVTRYETGEFIYYGPMKDKKPHGVGVAIYPQDDADGRKYYYGNFVDGERQDSEAFLFYKEGDFFYGSMKGDNWENGVLYKCSDGTYFRGTFKDNVPYTGMWYDHEYRYAVEKGQDK